MEHFLRKYSLSKQGRRGRDGEAGRWGGGIREYVDKNMDGRGHEGKGLSFEPLLFASSQKIGYWEEENRAPNMPFICDTERCSYDELNR